MKRNLCVEIGRLSKLPEESGVEGNVPRLLEGHKCRQAVGGDDAAEARLHNVLNCEKI